MSNSKKVKINKKNAYLTVWLSLGTYIPGTPLRPRPSGPVAAPALFRPGAKEELRSAGGAQQWKRLPIRAALRCAILCQARIKTLKPALD